jgi:hypothetical protein
MYHIWEKFNTFSGIGWHSSFVIPPDYVEKKQWNVFPTHFAFISLLSST